MKDTRLYIADQLVDIDSESIISLTYTLEETNNPTIVKNSFSKSISLPATANNNDLFGHIYDLSRATILDSSKMAGVHFNTLKRTPFQLFIEGELVESGYIQLTGISKSNGVPRYTIQAFGGLGDFLYNLMYDESGDKKSLASLAFGFEGYTGDPKDEMNFNITKNVVNNAWGSLPRSNRNIFAEAITFVPAYNGVAKDFDAQHALFNYNAVTEMNIPRTLSNSGTTYSSLNGYGCLEFNRSLDEPETRDLRSYLQRPAISVKALFDACCKDVNNGGYRVTLDPAFFNEGNAMYWDSYITLPMLSTNTESKDVSYSFGAAAGFVGLADRFVSESTLATIDVTSIATNARVNVNVALSLKLDTATWNYFTDFDEYAVEVNPSGDPNAFDHTYFKRSHHSAFLAQVLILDDNDDILAVSSEYAFSNRGKFDKTWKTYSPISADSGVVNVVGRFCNFIFVQSDTKSNTFLINASSIVGGTKSIKVVLRLQRVFPEKRTTGAGDMYISDQGVVTSDKPLSKYVITNKVVSIDTADSYAEVTTSHLPSISSNSLVTKDILLGNTDSPADYLLSYIKLFNLRLIKDIANKSVTITPNYFTGDIIDIDSRIDRGQAMNITPNLIDKKFLRMGLEQPDTYFATKYRNTYKIDYGQKRVDTGFDFNVDTEDIYDKNVYTSAVPCLVTSKYCYNYFNQNGAEVFAPLADDPKLILANAMPDKANFATASTQLTSAEIIDASKTTPFNIIKGYDLMPRMCYFDESEGTREAVDISNNLIIYNGKQSLYDYKGNAVSYWLTDDVPEMIHLAGKNCYLLTNSIYEEGIECDRLPQFLSMRINLHNTVEDSFDFGKSKESYIPGITYPDGVTLYDKYWSSLYADRLNVDTCKVTCFGDLSGMMINGEALRSFYYFDNNYWLLNKVVDYDPTRTKLTKCEFIKVQNTSSYFGGSDEATAATIEDNEE